MKKIVVAGAMVLILSASLGAFQAGAQKKDAKTYDHWLKEEVQLLVSQDEEAAFKKLKTNEEKDKFIELFWAKRDPSPGTKENEFKDEWYKRLEFVNKKYSRGSVSRGWHTDMGKVFMIFGPPTQIQGSQGGPKPQSSGGTQMEAPPETWTYQPMPDLGLSSIFTITFRNYQYGYELDQHTPDNIRRGMEMFPKLVVFNPDLKEVPMYTYTLDENSAEGKLVQNFMTSGQEVKQIALEWAPIFTRAMGGSTYVSLLVQIDPRDLDRKKLKDVTFFGRLKGEGEDVQDFLKPVRVEQEKADKLLLVFGFPAKPGKSVLYFGVEDKDKENYTLVKSDLDVLNFWNDELNTSSLLLSSQVVSKPKEEASAEFSPYVTSDFRATPRWGNVFKPSEFLSVLLQVYNAKTQDNEVNLTVDYFIVSQEVGYKLNPQTIKTKIEENKAIACGTEVPLSPLKPGKYTFKIRVTDKVANKILEKTAAFVVE